MENDSSSMTPSSMTRHMTWCMAHFIPVLAVESVYLSVWPKMTVRTTTITIATITTNYHRHRQRDTGTSRYRCIGTPEYGDTQNENRHRNALVSLCAAYNMYNMFNVLSTAVIRRTTCNLSLPNAFDGIECLLHDDSADRALLRWIRS